MRKVALLVLMVGLAALVMTGCVDAGQPAAKTSGHQVIMGASWAEAYGNLASLRAASALVVVGTFTAATQEPQDARGGMVFTDFTFKVSQALYNPKKLVTGASALITIHQTGGTINDEVYQFEDDPLFQVGEQAVLFLHSGEGVFWVVGGPNGRFEVKNGVVTPARGNPIQFSPMPLESFQAQVAAVG